MSNLERKEKESRDKNTHHTQQKRFSHGSGESTTSISSLINTTRSICGSTKLKLKWKRKEEDNSFISRRIRREGGIDTHHCSLLLHSS
mmetsp:Transcript_4929/g.5642  ORF Transcript_4929/g.5642 Transcript_4929/m.5642 type:complete len:88 (+) Transcript_4929:1980-2243(+)